MAATQPSSEQKQTAASKDQDPKNDPDKTVGFFSPKMFPKLAQLTDRFGNTFFFGNAGDYWHIPFPIGADNDYRTHARNIRDMEIRPDDVLICSFPKTGLHWHVEIMHMLKEKKVQFTDRTRGNMLDSFLDAKAITSFESLPSPRTLVTHVPFRYIPRQALEKKIKIVYLDRNPKDVLVSFYSQMNNHVAPFNYPGTFEHFFHLSLEVGCEFGVSSKFRFYSKY
ncbi:unnamed protein product, partial [Lymnaea stagnalis]